MGGKSKSFKSIFLPIGMFGLTNVPEQFFIIFSPSISVTFSSADSSFYSCLEVQSPLNSSPEMIRLFKIDLFCFGCNFIVTIFNYNNIFWYSNWFMWSPCKTPSIWCRSTWTMARCMNSLRHMLCSLCFSLDNLQSEIYVEVLQTNIFASVLLMVSLWKCKGLYSNRKVER